MNTKLDLFSSSFKQNFTDYVQPESPQWLEEAELESRITCRVTILENYVKKENTGFGAYTVEDEKEEHAYFSLNGVFPEFLKVGQTYSVTGVVQEYRGDKQIRGFEAKLVQPVSKHAIISYLRTLHGLKDRAEVLFDAYGNDSIDVLIHTPERAANEIFGVGKKSVEKWQAQLLEMQENSESTLALLNMGLTTHEVRKLLAIYGSQTLVKVRTNPYLLALQVPGYGFKKCDELAMKTDADLAGAPRLRAGIIHVLGEAEREGHCYLSHDQLVKRVEFLLRIHLSHKETQTLSQQFAGTDAQQLTHKAGKHEFLLDRVTVQQSLNQREFTPLLLMQIPSTLIEENMQKLGEMGRIVLETTGEAHVVYLASLYIAEVRASQNIVRLCEQQPTHVDATHVIDDYLERKGIHLEELQREAVERFVKNPAGLHILSGGGGCGKTFVINIILDILQLMTPRQQIVSIMAPTGRAAKVVSASTGRPASTIHLGLEYMGGMGFTRNEANPLDCDVLVVDELSMADILLFDAILRAVRSGCKVILVGDFRQLPSVGPGRVLRDMMEQGSVDCVTLNVPKRYAKKSGIAINSERILKGLVPNNQEETGDSYVLEVKSVQEMHNYVLNSVSRFMKLGYSMEDSQVLIPTKAGESGVDIMNAIVQQHFNPIQKRELTFLNKKIERKDARGSRVEELHFHKGDKVIHTKNNYGLAWHKKTGEGTYMETGKAGITNGEIGFIESVDIVTGAFKKKERQMWVRYDDIYVRYVNDFKELDHAYAITVHKSQGSQWGACLLVLMGAHGRLLENEIAYTGHSRAKKLQVTIGEMYAIRRAVENISSAERNTRLKERLQCLCKTKVMS